MSSKDSNVYLGEFDGHCRPNRNRTLIQIPVSIENQIFQLAYRLFGNDADSSIEIFRKKVDLNMKEELRC